ncbi:c-type cytochrome [Sphingobium algorifonticola]|uniref:C-type cytochrome n=2 Tax=Sphingobium algorifonticola TaxID=2008318 RepID=A0A437J530_9SPHN|nr:c-type cytochrome [Sphingobium algorifonticola]
MRPRLRSLCTLVLSLLVVSCAYRHDALDRGMDYATRNFSDGRTMRAPRNNPMTAAKVALGEALFHETRLSVDGSRSCASCHQPSRGFGDGMPRTAGRSGAPLPRHTPSLWNVGHAGRLFADGRAASLEAQSLMPITQLEEMGRAPGTVTDGIRDDTHYRRWFAEAFPKAPFVNETNLAHALASYQRTLISGTTPFDRWLRGDRNAISVEAQRGFAVFAGPGNCAACHHSANLTDEKFHDIGLPDGDRGRGAVTGRRAHDHRFRTPSLREIGRTAPYMHDGSLPTLEAVVDHYSDHVTDRGQTMRRVHLSADNKRDLIAFLKTLDSMAPATKVARAERMQRE